MKRRIAMGPGPGPLVGRLGHHLHAHCGMTTIVSNRWSGFAGWVVAYVDLGRPNKGKKVSMSGAQSRATFNP